MPQDEIRIEVVAGRDGRSDVRWLRGEQPVGVSRGVTPADAARIITAWDTHHVQVRRNWREQWMVIAGIDGRGERDRAGPYPDVATAVHSWAERALVRKAQRYDHAIRPVPTPTEEGTEPEGARQWELHPPCLDEEGPWPSAAEAFVAANTLYMGGYARRCGVLIPPREGATTWQLWAAEDAGSLERVGEYRTAIAAVEAQEERYLALQRDEQAVQAARAGLQHGEQATPVAHHDDEADHEVPVKDAPADQAQEHQEMALQLEDGHQGEWWVRMTRNGSGLIVESPYHDDFPTAARALGGRWCGETRTWTFASEAEEDVRQLCYDVFGAEAFEEWPEMEPEDVSAGGPGGP